MVSAAISTAGFDERKSSSFFFNARFYQKFYTGAIGLSLEAIAKQPAIFKALVTTAAEKFKQIKTMSPMAQYPSVTYSGELAIVLPECRPSTDLVPPTPRYALNGSNGNEIVHPPVNDSAGALLRTLDWLCGYWYLLRV